jgi:signal transduction histidine kinase
MGGALAAAYTQHMRLSLVSFFWFAIVCALFAPARAADELPVRHYESAELSISGLRQGTTLEETLTLSNVARPAEDAAWAPVALPDLKARSARLAAANEAEGQMRWYRLRYERPGPAPGAGSPPLALYVPRVVSGPVSVLLRVGTDWRVLYQSNERWLEEWNRPLVVELPPEAGPQVELVVGCSGLAGRGLHVLSTLWIGPLDAVRGRAYWRSLLQQQAPMATSVAILIVGLFALGVWWQRRQEMGYLYFALAAAAWCFRNLHYYIDIPRSDTAYEWFWWATNASLSWVMLLIYRFALRFDDRGHRGLERLLVTAVLVGSLINLPVLPWAMGTLLMQHLINGVAGLGVALYMTWLCWRGAGPELRAITLALWVGQLFGLNDLLLVGGRMNPETIYLLPYAPLVVLGTFVYATLRRYVQAIAQVEGANEQLEARLREREAQLQANHERLAAAEREQALLRERQRLMADMHDGIGSTLTSALILLEQGEIDRAGVAAVVRECVDDLRLVIDSLEPVENDLVMLLATLRHRLGRRLEAAGVTLVWAMDDLPPLPWLSPPDALQILRLVQEVLTNVLKHAGAQRVQMSLRCADGQTVELRIEDDGCGFDTAAGSSPERKAAGGGRGMSNLRLRARQLKSKLDVQSKPGHGTVVRLLMPVQRL